MGILEEHSLPIVFLHQPPVRASKVVGIDVGVGLNPKPWTLNPGP